MSNSKLIDFTQISPNRNSPRNHAIDRITPHCVVGQCSVEALGNLFANPGRQASSNYGIGYDARVGMFCPEEDRSWCSSSPANDHRAITIECASDNYYPFAFNWVVYMKLVDLCVDICQRYGKTKLLWLGHDNYEPKSNEMLLTVHRWYAATECPGEWLMGFMGDLASRVNAKLADRDYLMNGDEGEAVKAMQVMLIACGYSCGSYGADGEFGDATEAALIKFQKAAKIDADGLYGPVSKKALEEAYVKKHADPDAGTEIFYVQAGAYKYKKNAVDHAQKLKSAGFPAIVKNKGNFVYVQVGAYKVLKNAQAMVDKLKAKGFSAFVTK